MGIYPTEKVDIDRKTGMLKREYNDFSGKVVTTYYQPVLVIEERTHCFCCSCGEREGSDPYCRNHGGNFGLRPCEEHGMPGSTIIDWIDGKEVETNEMPESVQQARARDREAGIHIAD